MGTCGKQRRERLLDALGALADVPHGVAALRALRGQRRIGAAVMAAQARGGQMHGEPRVAVAAGRDPAAGRAGQRRRIAAPVDVHQHLAAGGEMALHGLDRRRGDSGAHRVLAQIDDRGARRQRLSRTPWQ